MGKLFGRQQSPATTAPAPMRGNEPFIPLSTIRLETLAELTRRSALILTMSGRGIQGSREQAQRFDDWLESYRDRAPQPATGDRGDEMQAMLETILRLSAQGAPSVEVSIPVVGKVQWWQPNQPDTRFACVFYSYNARYFFPPDADDVPNITEFAE